MIVSLLVSTLILGDSIAEDLGKYAHLPYSAKSGISSCRILRDYIPPKHYDRVIVSAGSNDPPGRCVEAIRAAVVQRVRPSVIQWVVPAVPGARGHVLAVARSHGDWVLWFTAGRDHVHPRSYKEITKQMEK